MPLPNLLRKASSFILGSHSGIPSPPFNEGEVVFCKNNVCVHPPTLLRQDCDVVHHPGYLTVTCQQSSDINKFTLHLSWIPNTTLRRNPWTVEKGCGHTQSGEEQNTEGVRTSRCYSNEFNCPVPLSNSLQQSLENVDTGCSCNVIQQTKDNSSVGLQISQLPERRRECGSCRSRVRNFAARRSWQADHHSLEDHFILNSPDIDRPSSLGCKGERNENCIPFLEDNDSEAVRNARVLNEQNNADNKCSISPSPSVSSISSLAPPLLFLGAGGDDVPTWMSSPEMLALQHNLTFPESATASPVPRRAHKCRRFSVDLSQMRSLRLFFSDAASTCGQLVVASRESQYKILHFHHGGLDHLAKVLQEWNFLLHFPQPSGDDLVPYRHFMVCRPEVGQDELHPEEGLVPPISQELWMNLLNEDGQLEDDLTLRKGIFFGGLQPEMRSTVWPFLLHCFTFQSTYDEREQIVAIRRQEYSEITRRRLEMDEETRENFWRNIQCVVEKDVVRTDRGNPYFAGNDNPHIEDMKNILLNYAVYNPKFGYTQGMSDLLAPVLAEVKNEPDAFWCFVGLMQKAIFVCTPTDNDMDRNLNYLRELIHLMVPEFYAHLQKHADAMELLFCHRWILLCFKREFPEAVALRMWEACWANYLTDYFHLFLCLAIVCIYSDDVIAQELRTDEMLLHFSSLAMYMDGELILRKMFRFEISDRVLLAEICKEYPILFDKGYSTNIIQCKREAWARIVQEFNASTPGKKPRDAFQLKGLLKRMKMSAQSHLNALRVDNEKSGGGPAKEILLDEAEKMVANLLENINDPIEMQHDNDALPFQEGAGSTLMLELLVPQEVSIGAGTDCNLASSSSSSSSCTYSQMNETSQRSVTNPGLRPLESRNKESFEDEILAMARKEHNLRMEILQLRKKTAEEHYRKAKALRICAVKKMNK